MVSTWIEAPAKGRHGGPVRAGMWSTVVVGTHPVQADQAVWVEFKLEDQEPNRLPGYWLENRGVNSFWHVALPPQAVGSRIRYRAMAQRTGEEPVASPHQEFVVRPNLPMKTELTGALSAYPEGLVGNRRMTVKVDRRSATYDIFFPTVGLHSDARPFEGELAQSRLHFQAIQGGLAAGRRLDWFDERLAWEVEQEYQGATNILETHFKWRHGPFRVRVADFAAMGTCLPRTAGGNTAAGQYLKRYQIFNDSSAASRVHFGLFVHAEVNGGVGETGLAWHDDERVLVAFNRGHMHVNRKLSRDSTIEFAIALDDRGETVCEAVGSNEVMLLRQLEVPPGGSVRLDVLVSGAFTGWSGDAGTFEHWTRPALAWFRTADLDQVEQETAEAWQSFIDPLPALFFPRPDYASTLQRSTLAVLLHSDDEFGSSAGGYDRGLSAYAWPRDSLAVAGILDRCGHPAVGRRVFDWLSSVRNMALRSPHAYWFQKYTIDGWPEWETPSLDQSAFIPWSLERHCRRTGDLDLVARNWRTVESAAQVCCGISGHPGMVLLEDRHLIRSAGKWDNRFAGFLYSNAAAVASLRAACRLAERIDRRERVAEWNAVQERIWKTGILGSTQVGSDRPGLYEEKRGRFLEARAVSRQRGIWASGPGLLIEHSMGLDVSMLGIATPLGLLPCSDERVVRTAEAIRTSCTLAEDPHAMTIWSADAEHPEMSLPPGEAHRQDASSMAALWMARYLIQLGKDTGEPAHWTSAVQLLDNVLERLGSLGLAYNAMPRPQHGLEGVHSIPKVCHLHVPMIEALLDLAGLDYDAAAKVLVLEPALPPSWPELGMEQELLCGRVAYRLQAFTQRRFRHRINLTATLAVPVTLKVSVAARGIKELAAWQTNVPGKKPVLDAKLGRLSWTVDLPQGAVSRDWSWG